MIDNLKLNDNTGLTVVFVYGTLKSDGSNYPWHLSEAIFLGDATLNGYAMNSAPFGRFPYIYKSDYPSDTIKGELYLVDAMQEAMLDILEGVPMHYQRSDASVYNENTGKYYDSVLVYTYTGDEHAQLEERDTGGECNNSNVVMSINDPIYDLTYEWNNVSSTCSNTYSSKNYYSIAV